MTIEGPLMCRVDLTHDIERGLAGVAKAMTMLIEKIPDGKCVSKIRFEPKIEGEDDWLFRFVAEVED